MSKKKSPKTIKKISTRLDAARYLRRFGYLPEALEPAKAPTDESTDDALVAAAIAEFQQVALLPRTGAIDARTAAAMNRPRCGTPDRHRSRSAGIVANFVATGTVWQRAILNYQITAFTNDITQADQERLIRTAFDRWSAVVPLVFRAVRPRSGIT